MSNNPLKDFYEGDDTIKEPVEYVHGSTKVPEPPTALELTEDAARFDRVNHPEHYTRFPVEVIEITECLNFNKGNAVKYICRAGYKDGSSEIEDLEKAEWYIQREIERIRKSNG